MANWCRAVTVARGRPAIEPGEWGRVTCREVAPGKWQAHVFAVTPRGERRRHRVTRSNETAAIREATRLAKATAGDGTDHDGAITPKSTVVELVTAYLDHHGDELADNSKRVYESANKLHIEPAIGRMPLRAVTTPVLDKWLRELTPGTAKTCRALLGGAFSQAVRWGAVSVNPVRNTRAPKQAPAAPEALTAAEFREWRARIAAYQDPDGDRPGPNRRAQPLLHIVDTIAGTGARPSEVLAMRWEDLDLESTPATAFLRGTKTDNAPRTVVLPRFAVDALKRQRAELGAAADLYPHVWISSTGRPIDTSRLNRWYRNVRDYWQSQNKGAVDTLPHITSYSFRDTVATIVAEALGDDAASRQLGHADSSITRKHYIQKCEVGPDVADVLDGTLMAQ